MMRRYGITYVMVKGNETAESYIELRVNTEVHNWGSKLIYLMNDIAVLAGYECAGIERMEELNDGQSIN